MNDYDVVVVGGGINGLTVAAYLAKAGLSVGVFEARGQCGAHCDTVELGLPGFLHNPHAAWLVPAISPAMADLELDVYGLELRGTDVLFAKTFSSGSNLVQATDPAITGASIARVSDADRAMQERIDAYLIEHADDALEMSRSLFTAATPESLDRACQFYAGLLSSLDIPISGEDFFRMNAFEALEVFFESEEVKTARSALSEFMGQWPLHRRTAPQVFATGAALAVHTARGGSHALTHALVKCVVAHGGKIWTTCPVEKIIVEEGRARGIRLSPDALLPGEEIRAKAVVSNLTLAPTFLGLLGDEVVEPSLAGRVRRFSYDEPLLLGVYYALSDDPQFSSASYDPAIQRAWVGYLGGETMAEVRSGFAGLVSGIIPDEIMAGWFIPTRADPTQAPEGCHTCFAWMSVPPRPWRWRGRRLSGWASWPELAEPLADAVTERIGRYAPGFAELVLERHVMTPMHQEHNNPSAIYGNMIGGSAYPEQFAENRPIAGVLAGGATRSVVPGLYLSNSIHPYGATHLAAGYVAAGEVAEDMGCRDQSWWAAEPLQWFFERGGEVPLNLGVAGKWCTGDLRVSGT